MLKKCYSYISPLYLCAKFVMQIEKISNDKEIFSIYMDFDNAETSSKF